MARALTVTFAPPHRRSALLDRFAAELREALAAAGATVLPLEDALGPNGKIRPGIVTVEQGEAEAGAHAVHRVATLYRNPLVALLEEPPPVEDGAPLQAQLDGIIGALAWNLTHLPVFVQPEGWTAVTMNGASVRDSLIPKLTAQVVPPDPARFTFRPGALDVSDPVIAPMLADFAAAAAVWARNGKMLSHTRLDDLRYKSRLARRIVAAYLDHRTGMSYGFLVRQLPVAVRPAVRREAAPPALALLDWEARPVQEVDGRSVACVALGGAEWLVDVPHVAVLGTRSGCDKTAIVPERDLVRLGWAGGPFVLDTPAGAGESRPSYDTLAILAHALGNAIVASVARAHDAADPLARALETTGLSMSHWHGYPASGRAPEGFATHGADNPPVSCSTPQSAVYALAGKLAAFEARLAAGDGFRGDLHVEPHHGTVLTGALSLLEAARWVDACG